MQKKNELVHVFRHYAHSTYDTQSIYSKLAHYPLPTSVSSRKLPLFLLLLLPLFSARLARRFSYFLARASST